MFVTVKDNHGPGAGSALNPILLAFAGLSTLIATVVSATSIYLHLKNYRKPQLQRYAMFPMTFCPFPSAHAPRRLQNGYSNHVDGSYIRRRVSYRIIFSGSRFRHRCYP